MIRYPAPTLILPLLLCSLICSDLKAESNKELPYGPELIYPTAIRYIRVDRDLPITEKDKEGGYIIFKYKEKGGKLSRASLKLIDKGSDKAARTMLVIKINNVPTFMEREFLDKLERKLIKERK